MTPDIKIYNKFGGFKYRICGIVVANNKLLVCKMHKNNFWAFPGGHCEIGEDSKTAVLREMREETGFEVKLNKLVAFSENIFKHKNKPFHELALYYHVEPADAKNFVYKDYSRLEHDKEGDVSLEFKWIDLNEIDKFDIKPTHVRDLVKKREFLKDDFKFVHLINKE